MPARRLRVLTHGPAPGARNMALDEALLGAAREGRLTLRLYAWDPPSLSLGRHQRARGRYDLEALAGLGADVVRRPTGGRAVYHDRELTYAVTAPLDLWGGLRPAYARINRALARGLRSLGVPATVGTEGEGGPEGHGGPPGGRRLLPGTRACFRDPAPGEITAGGRKLVGSAQWREGGALLQHGSILLEDQQGLAEGLRLGAAPPAAGAGPPRPGSDAPPGGRSAARAVVSSSAVGLAELLPRVPGRSRLLAALVAGFEAELGVRPVEGRLEARESERARRLEAKYRESDWTWRR